MPKVYEFHSQLSQKDFLHLLAFRAKNASNGCLLAEVNGTYVELMDLGSIQIYGQIPFSGEVLPERTGCVLRGGFYLWAVMSWRFLLLSWLLVLAVGTLFGVPILVSAVVGALWLGLSA